MTSEVKIPPPSHNPREDVLSNEDLLDIIFGYVRGGAQYDNVDTDNPKQCLLHLALTCKTFLESALNALWHTLPALLPLFKVLPSLALVDEIYRLDSVITDEAWARICYYGKRVRGVVIAPGSNQQSRFVYQLVALKGNQGRKGAASTLLPNLHHVTVECRVLEVDYLGVFFLLGSSLEKVEIKQLSSQTKDVEFCQELLVGLYQNSTKLRELVLEGTATPVVAEALSQVGRLKSLSSLSLELSNLPLSLALLTLFGSLPELSYLAINAATMDPSPPLPPTHLGVGSNSTSFTSLLKLEVIGTPSTISRTLSRTLTSRLKQLHLTGTAEDSQTDLQPWQDCFYKIAESCKSLRSIKVSSWNGGDLTLDINMLSPELDMGTIECLHLDISTLTGSGVLDKIGKSCPNLTLLALPALSGGEDNPDLSCLGYLAKACPKLKDLSLCLRLEHPQSGAGIPTKNHPLTRLRLGNAGDWPFKLREALPMAEFLDRLFPSLETLEAYRNSRGEMMGDFEAMEQMSLLVTALKGAALRSK
ncbi:hypothetical protein BKA70DRAFT_1405301 [Coprinopsis sp. MPI-PUGE-AT-0042]|nr:hypothetical protein BKA70DRAFT_1405301 [Coprinopsis sp. MPI-PUGE-AT-0042]